MKLIIAGTRSLYVDDYLMERLVIHFKLYPSEIVCGGAKGIDECGERYAQAEVKPVKYFEADWDKHGRAAGPVRNSEMAKYADALLLIWNGSSPGSLNMKLNMEKLSKPVYEVILNA